MSDKPSAVDEIMRIVVKQALGLCPDIGVNPGSFREDIKKKHPEWLELEKKEVQ